MSTMDYASLQDTATQTIRMMGRAAVLRAIEGGAETPVTALMSNFGTRERDGSLITHDDRRALIAADPGVVPDPERHRFVLDGQALRIITVRAVQPAETVLYFDCQVRG